jgi:hypothetical protein
MTSLPRRKIYVQSSFEEMAPLATGVAVATLPDCFGNEFEKFIVGLRVSHQMLLRFLRRLAS